MIDVESCACVGADYVRRTGRRRLWQPLCYAQIGGLTVATFVTLLLVPVMYSIFVLDLKIVKWEGKTEAE